jgi:hypothetical protein
MKHTTIGKNIRDKRQRKIGKQKLPLVINYIIVAKDICDLKLPKYIKQVA